MTHPETPGETLLEGMPPGQFTRQVMATIENLKDAVQVIRSELQASQDAIALLEWFMRCQETMPVLYRVDYVDGTMSLVNTADPTDHAPLKIGSELLIARPAPEAHHESAV